MGGGKKEKHGCTCRRGVCPGVLVSGGRPGEIGAPVLHG